jgi:hypothetical protein
MTVPSRGGSPKSGRAGLIGSKLVFELEGVRA